MQEFCSTLHRLKLELQFCKIKGIETAIRKDIAGGEKAVYNNLYVLLAPVPNDTMKNWF